jgi:hypothetical protein
MMNRKQLEKALNRMQYDLKDTGVHHGDARWMVRSRVLDYHWSFKTLDGVRRFVVDEHAMRSQYEDIAASGEEVSPFAWRDE